VAERLGDIVRELRDWTRLGQRDFALAAHVAKNTIGRLETGQAKRAETATLRLIAEAAVREAAGAESGKHDVEAAYRRLLIASGHLSESASAVIPQPEPPEDPIRQKLEETFGRDSDKIADFLVQAADFDQDDKLFLLQTFAWLRTLMPQGRDIRIRNAALARS
jgi:transcriptional regulator with XRE-family HTH domain